MADRIVKKVVFPSPANRTPIRRVAAYVRVSTDKEEQEHSLETQKHFYQGFISSNKAWQMVEIYVDNGISGLSYRNRDAFNRMIADAMSGKIDLIITKSISRFARNTVDTIKTIRELKAAGIEVFFEKEQIRTFDSKSEFVLTLMSCFAQEESRSMSENIVWGKRKAFSEGKYSVGYSFFLGYDKGDGNAPLRINPKEAVIVRYIFLRFLEGDTAITICRDLERLEIPTPAQKKRWRNSTVVSILNNEKYVGDALLQKEFTVDFLTKKMKKNEHELPMYYVTNGHEGILTRKTYEIVQQELQFRKSFSNRYSCAHPLCGKIICRCGSAYGRRTANHGTQYPYVRWCCIKYRPGENHDRAIKESLLFDAVKNAIAQCFRTCAMGAIVREIMKYLPDAQRPLAQRLFEEMSAGENMELFSHERTWRYIIKEIRIEQNKTVNIKMLGE